MLPSFMLANCMTEYGLLILRSRDLTKHPAVISSVLETAYTASEVSVHAPNFVRKKPRQAVCSSASFTFRPRVFSWNPSRIRKRLEDPQVHLMVRLLSFLFYWD